MNEPLRYLLRSGSPRFVRDRVFMFQALNRSLQL